MAVSASDFAWHASAVGKTILLSGAVGSGKSTIMRLGYRALSAHWGPTATIDTDTIVMMVDPTWELSDEERDYELAGWQIWLLARSFLSRGFECVLIGGNAPHTPDRALNDLIGRLLGVGDVYHVTLDPSPAQTQRRVAQRGGGPRPEWVTEHVGRLRATYQDWTCRVDNSRLSPLETVAEIAARIEQGHGKLTEPIQTE